VKGSRERLEVRFLERKEEKGEEMRG